MEYDNERYDGSGLTVREGARQLAVLLELDSDQAARLVAELRNALVPVHVRCPTRGTARTLALAEELERLALAEERADSGLDTGPCSHEPPEQLTGPVCSFCGKPELSSDCHYYVSTRTEERAERVGNDDRDPHDTPDPSQ